MLGFLRSSGTAPSVAAAPVIDDQRETTPYNRLTVRACEQDERLFYAANGVGERYLGMCAVGMPLVGAGAGTVDSLVSALSHALPAGSFVQIGRLCAPDIVNFIDDYLSRKAQAAGFLAVHAAEVAELYRRSTEVPLVDRSGVKSNRQQLIVTVSVPCSIRPDAAEAANAAREAQRIFEGLKTAGVHLFPLDGNGYLALMRRFFHLYSATDSQYDEETPIREQVFGPGDAFKVERDQINFNDGEYYARALSVKYFPKKASLAIMNYLIGDPLGIDNQLTDPYWMACTIHYPDQVAKKAQVMRKYGMINHQVFGPTSRLIPILGYKKAGFDTLVHEIEGKNGFVIEANLTFFLFGKDPDALAVSTSKVRSYYGSMGFEVREDRRVLEPLFFATLPLNASREGVKGLQRFHSMSVRHFAQFLPLIGEWEGGGDACSLFVSRRGVPIGFSLFNSTTNFNANIIAESGSGKSYLMQWLISDLLAEGARIWTVDAGKSYYKLCKAQKGEFMSFNESSQLCLNPFTHIDDIDDEMDLLKAMLSKMAAPEEGLDDFRMAVLEEAVKAVWNKHYRKGSVTAVAEWCNEQEDQRIRDIGRQLYPFTRRGSFGRWFEGANNLDFKNSFVVCELGELKSKPILQKVVLMQLMARISVEMFLTQGRRKVLVVDEAWELLNDPAMAKAMEAFYRKARKHKGAIVVVTQGVGDFFNSPNGEAIYENSSWNLILSQKEESINAALKNERMALNPYAERMLRSLHTAPGKYSEIMIKRSTDDWGIARLVVDPFSNVLFSTKDEERDDIIEVMESGVDVVDAINGYLARQAGGRPTIH